jgi:TM2 domain-containing membrane protein YozV
MPEINPNEANSKKITAGICGLLIGALGVHKFILGYTTEGLIMLLVTVLTCGFGGAVMGIIGLVEGIVYLTKTDEEFLNTYMVNKKGWL